jgi:hypothetical protein
MNIKIRTLTAFSAIGLSCAALPAFGGELLPLHVNVPFAFTAGKTSLPAGEYTVSENQSGMVTVRGERSAVLLLSIPGNDSQDEKNALSFERTSKGFQLRTIHAAGRPTSVLPAPAGEK